MKFEPGTRVRLKTAPDRAGVVTGKVQESGRGRRVRYQVDFGDRIDYVNANNLEANEESYDIYDLLESGKYGSVINLRSVITHTRLTGRLADVIYSMNASNTVFFPYQFKPVLNFLDSPSNGILIADEVGLGKTIEAGLIWTELRARLDANKLLILCPAVLREKWQEELAHRFGVKATICNAGELLKILKDQKDGKIDGFSVIASLQGMRPTKGWDTDDEIATGSAQLARFIQDSDVGDPVMDCLIVDEAHYLRNPSTQSHKLVRLIRPVTDHIVLLSATPIQLHNKDLFHLLNLIDSENFRFEFAFQRVLEANQPLIKLASRLRREILPVESFKEGLQECRSHPLFLTNRQLEYLEENPPSGKELSEPAGRESLATRIERVNLLARVVNRTRKRDVQENKVLRNPYAPQVIMNETEQEFYNDVTQIVREYCTRKELSDGFILTIPQRQLCSSMPAAYRAWVKKLTDEYDEDLIFESGVQEEEKKKKAEVGPLIRELSDAAGRICTYEQLREGDTKFHVLLEQLRKYWSQYPDKKVILFSYYRETLFYLQERLQEEKIETMLLIGGMKESKHEMIERFRQDGNIKILLASEVASEGVDLQFSSFLINYDLPWNPMRVEQRIGRIDRIGQSEAKINIFNFFYADTLDDRIYTRLYDRLDIFQSALGDIEAVLGEKIHKMAFELLSHELTKEDELKQIEQTQLAIEHIKRQQEQLEEEAAQLAAHGEYVLNKVKAARDLRRYIDADNLWVYVRDFLSRHFKGTNLVRISDSPLTAELELSQDAKVEFRHFLEKTKTGEATVLAKAATGRPVKCVFSNAVDFSNRNYEVINQYHPLVKFIRQHLSTQEFHPVVAVAVNHSEIPSIPKGIYMVVAVMWSTSGSRTIEKLVFKGGALGNEEKLDDDDAERLITAAVSSGVDWIESRSEVNAELALDKYGDLVDIIENDFDHYANLMDMENSDRIDYLIKTIKDKITSQIQSYEHTLLMLELEGKTRTIPARKKRISNLKEYMQIQEASYEKQRMINTEQSSVTTGIIKVV